MKKIVHILILICAAFLLFSCKKKDDPQALGSLYGTVTDKNTGQNIHNAWVELLPAGLKAITGQDGHFEFTNVEEGAYRLHVTKGGYADYITNDVLLKGNEDNKPVFILLELLPPALTILDDNRHQIDTIDFGSIEGDVLRSFTIFNDSEEPLEWEIVYVSDWIKAFSKSQGTIAANGTQSIVITIDRSLLQNGQNSTVVHIVSNNGSKQITVMASTAAFIETMAATDVTPSTAVLNGRINKLPSSSIMEYGFVYGTMPTPSLDNGAIKVVCKGTAQIGSFSAEISELTQGTTYFVRAYILTLEEEYYGTTLSFAYEEMQCVTLPTANLMVQKYDLGFVDQHSAVTMCESSTIGGYFDWRLPTKEELMTLYTNKEYIGGFKSGYYWASTSSSTYYYIDFKTGALDWTSTWSTDRNVRAVRTLK